MSAHVPLAWLQLAKRKGRLLAAVAGITFAGLLMLVHLGIQDALFESAVLLHGKLDCDLVITSSQYQMLIRSHHFTERRLYQALGVEGVESAASLYLGLASFKNPWSRKTRDILLIGFEPKKGVFELAGADEMLAKIREPGTVLFDSRSRPEYGPVAETFRQEGSVVTEVASRQTRVTGLFAMGTSFGFDGALITSDLNFLRLIPAAKPGLVALGLVKLKADSDLEDVRARLVEALPVDVNVLTRQEFIDVEVDYWANSTPIGFSTLIGVVMGWVVGAVIVYQILQSDVSDHLAEYATLKAMGYSDRYLFGIVMQEGLILSVMGILPSVIASEGVYYITRQATLLPAYTTWERALMVYSFTLGMCIISALFAARQIRSADPADIF